MSETLPTPYQQSIHVKHYARWREEDNRREHWDETVDRYMDAAIRRCDELGAPLGLDDRAMLRNGILNCWSMPSMRALMTAGPALDRDHVAGYNCSFVPVDDLRAFDEALFILCCGTGVGYSVEKVHVDKLPVVPDSFVDSRYPIVVEDSKEGWGLAFRSLLYSLSHGLVRPWDTSRVRPAGVKLKTFGGRASGPEPLEDLFRYAIDLFKQAAGRRLTTVEVHKLMCKVGDIVVVGGVRRSALICLYDPWDEAMRHVKDGAYWEHTPHLRLANNSIAFNERPSREEFYEQLWEPLRNGKSGEPGIINRSALRRKAAENGRRDADQLFGTNPCGEIILRPYQFCNLSEVVARADDDFAMLVEKVRLATILGTIQSTFTDFRYLRPIWKQNCEEERLLGVSITGAVDNPILNGSRGDAELRATLHALKHVAIDTNAEWAKRLGINPAAAITCNKPSGTVSQLVLSGSGINEWHSEYFVRTIRADKKDPAAQLLYLSGVYAEDDVMAPDSTFVFSWPIKAPEGALTRKDMPALKKLKLWLAYQEAWCEHNPSTTINVKDREWDEVGEFVFEHFDRIAGIAFLPYDDHVYPQAPYQEIDELAYHRLVAETPAEIDWTLLSALETTDHTTGTKELACLGASCDVAA